MMNRATRHINNEENQLQEKLKELIYLCNKIQAHARLSKLENPELANLVIQSMEEIEQLSRKLCMKAEDYDTKS